MNFESLYLKTAVKQMKNFKNTFFYIIVTGGFTALIYWIISKGKFLETVKTASIVLNPSDHWKEFISSMVVNFQDPLAILLAIPNPIKSNAITPDSIAALA